MSCQIWSLASCDLVIWGLGSLSESENVWGGGEKSLTVSNTNQFISQSINMSIYQTFTMHRGLALNSGGSCQGVYVRLASLLPPSPWFAHVGALHPGLGLTAEKGWARPAEGGKVGSEACQGLRDVSGGLTPPVVWRACGPHPSPAPLSSSGCLPFAGVLSQLPFALWRSFLTSQAPDPTCTRDTVLCHLPAFSPLVSPHPRCGPLGGPVEEAPRPGMSAVWAKTGKAGGTVGGGPWRLERLRTVWNPWGGVVPLPLNWALELGGDSG